MLAERVLRNLHNGDLIYTRAGVLDMTRRRVNHKPAAVERIVATIERGAI